MAGVDPGLHGELLTAVRAVLGCPVQLVTEISSFAAELEASACFRPDLQPALAAGHLRDLVARMDPETTHELREPLGLVLTMFWVKDRLVVIGPYTEQALDPDGAEALLGSLHIPAAHLHPYTLYRARFPIVDPEYVRRAAAALRTAAGQDVRLASSHVVTTADAPMMPGSDDPPHSASFAVINDRYAVEQEFMHAVRDGDEPRALRSLRRMAGIPQAPSYLNTPFLGASIIRIMARVAAQQGGLPPVTIDAISQTYAQRLHRRGHTTDIASAMQDITAMVADFCRHVRRHQQRPYTRLVREAMDEIELHLSHHVSSRELANRLHISESHLARRFKAETGRTLSEHVARERASRAAHLLRTTNQPVRDIAAYVGYPDANYFVKVFKGVYDLTPSAYRSRSTSR